MNTKTHSKTLHIYNTVLQNKITVITTAQLQYISAQQNIQALENVAIANALQLEAARRRAVPISPLIRRPCQVWSRSAYPLPSYSVFPADTLRYAVTLNFHPVTLTYDLWPWTCSRPASPRSNSVQNLSEIGQSAAELLQLEYLTLWPWTCTGPKFAKLWITQPGIVRFRSNLPQTMTTWHQTYHKLSRSTGQMSRS